MSRHPFLLISSSLGRDLNEWSRHHFSCQDFSSCSHAATCIACRDFNLTLELKTSCEFFCLRRPLLWLCRQILVATSELCRDIIYLLLVSRHQSDVATQISSFNCFLESRSRLSLSQLPFSSHDFTCSCFSFFFKAKFVAVVTWNCWELSFLSQLKFLVVTSILLQADLF